MHFCMISEFNILALNLLNTDQNDERSVATGDHQGTKAGKQILDGRSNETG